MAYVKFFEEKNVLCVLSFRAVLSVEILKKNFFICFSFNSQKGFQ